MQISTANISETVTDGAYIAIVNIYEVTYYHLIGIFTFNLGPF